MNPVVFSLRALRRDWRSGELRILSIALIIAVGSVTAVGFFTDRVRQVMHEQASELLAADLVIASSDSIDISRVTQAQRNTLLTARTLSFRSMALAGEWMHLVELKAVDDNYPLRGALRIASQPFSPDRIAPVTPQRGEVWASARLLQELRVEVDDSITLGEGRFKISQVLTYEPDRGGDFFSIAPRVLMNIADVPRTRLIQPGSRVKHRLLVAGNRGQIDDFRNWLVSNLKVNERVLTLEEGRPELRAALERARRFLGLAALVSVFLAGVAVAMGARRYAIRHLDTSAIMRCFGATQRDIVSMFAWEMLWLALFVSLAGCAVGYVAQGVLAWILGGLVATELPWPSFVPVLVGLPIGVVVLIGFALPPLLALRHVPPARVLRRDLGSVSPSYAAVYAVAMAAIVMLMAWQARDFKLLAYIVGGTAVTLLALGFTAFVLVRLLSRLRSRVGVTWRFGFANIARRASASTAQIVAFGLGIMALLLLSIVRGDLLEGWQRTIPENAPNHFLINIQPDQVEGVREFLSARGVTTPALYPMVRARLTAINGNAVIAETFTDDHARRHARREFNLSWAEQLQSDNRVVAGKWWTPEDVGRRLMSFEQSLAETLGITLDDRLSYSVAGSKIELRVSNLRAVEWDSFNVNFFTILPPGVLDEFPATYITSFYLPSNDRGILASMIKHFPNVTVIDVDALMNKVRQLMDRVSLAVEYVFGFTVLAGLAVLYAAIQTTQDERRYESAVLRTLGARRRQLLRSLIAEFVTLGLLAGAIAGLTASALGYVLAEYVFHFDYRLNPWLWLIGLVGGAVGIGVAGTLGTRSALRQPPAKTLREV